MPIERSIPNPAFIHLFTEYLGLSAVEIDRLLEKFHVRTIAKRSFLVQAGEVNTHLAYVNKGCSRSFTMDSKGKEHVLFFGFEDWWLADYESLMTRKPGKQYVQAIEDLELLCIANEALETLCNVIPALRKWRQGKQLKMVISMIDRLIEVKSCTPEERILKMARSRPDIFQRVSMQDIASYLDIEPPSLSRIRRRMLEGERST